MRVLVSLHLKFAIPQMEIMIIHLEKIYTHIVKIVAICIATMSANRLQKLIMSSDKSKSPPILVRSHLGPGRGGALIFARLTRDLAKSHEILWSEWVHYMERMPIERLSIHPRINWKIPVILCQEKD
ncbi:hypothetical protein DK846_09310 [Methanospirillum lacunae]|uniref:Uncharacterized protein n=1 Tax=Methanospirillum lacunae TaxID=668570 RepID=A0A2V2MVJ5_9EURY|nr:hypothetical protein DK846_09310 [Methanospirillum lacunae]